MDSKCNSSGNLNLVLKPKHKCILTGIFILPPICWLESFDYYAEFEILFKCEMVKDRKVEGHEGLVIEKVKKNKRNSICIGETELREREP